MNAEINLYRSPDEVSSWLRGFFRRRWKLMLTAALLILALVVGYLLMATPVYVASSVVGLDPRRNTINEMGGAVLTNPTPTDDVIETEVLALQSREIAGRVVEKLDLGSRPGFATPKQGGIKGWLKQLVYGDPPTAVDADPARHAEEQLLRNLEVSRVGRSYGIRIGYRSLDPVQAAEIANALASTYVNDQATMRADVKSEANKELAESLETLRVRLAAADRQLADARARAGVVDAKGASGSEIAMLKEQSAQARAEAALASGRTAASSVDNAVNNSPVIQQLRTRVSELRAQREVARTRYGPDHPVILNSIESEKSLNDQIAQESAEIRRVVQEGLRAEARAQAGKAQSQAGSLAQAKAELATQISRTGRIASLETEANSLRALYDAELERFKQVTGALADHPTARILASAVPPQVPKSPNPKLTLAIGALLAIIGALSLGVLADLLGLGRREDRARAV